MGDRMAIDAWLLPVDPWVGISQRLRFAEPEPPITAYQLWFSPLGSPVASPL